MHPDVPYATRGCKMGWTERWVRRRRGGAAFASGCPICDMRMQNGVDGLALRLRVWSGGLPCLAAGLPVGCPVRHRGRLQQIG